MDDMKIKLISKQIDNTLKFIKPFLPLTNCHMVEFITENCWETFIPTGIAEEVDKFGTKEAINTFWNVRGNILLKNLPTTTIQRIPNNGGQKNLKNLVNFIEEADKHCLKADGVLCLTVDQLREKFTGMGAIEVDSLKIEEFMSNKKSHEVEVLSSIVAMLASSAKVNYTIELGGGRGFLATMLNMVYDMPVLNIDCAESNAKGAEKRNKKMKKKWPGLVKKAEFNKSGSIPEINKDIYANNFQGSVNETEISPNNSIENQFSKEVDNEKTILDGTSELSVKNQCNKDGKTNNLYKHVTDFVSLDTDLLKHVKCEFKDHPCDINLCLTGLHTCGDLGSTTVKLFNKSSESSILCAVPCCYHLLTEQTFENPLSETKESFQNQKTGFPMSEHLNGFTIGRNARMLASQSIERFSDSQLLPSDSLFYRALLQVILKKHYEGNAVLEGKLKGIAEKCSDFTDYQKLAFIKLKIDRNKINLTDEELNQFEKAYSIHKDNLNLFYLLKMCLAPVIESIVLLDRLMFLVENGFVTQLGGACLVKMFDPVVSPRCHALVAYRKMYLSTE